MLFLENKVAFNSIRGTLRIKWFEIYSSVVFEKMFVVYSKNIHAM